MGILERISTVVRSNINDLIDKAEDPEKMDQLIASLRSGTRNKDIEKGGFSKYTSGFLKYTFT